MFLMWTRTIVVQLLVSSLYHCARLWASLAGPFRGCRNHAIKIDVFKAVIGPQPHDVALPRCAVIITNPPVSSSTSKRGGRCAPKP
jgi:hypothetical protein